MNNRGKGLQDKGRMESTPHSGKLGKENQDAGGAQRIQRTAMHIHT